MLVRVVIHFVKLGHGLNELSREYVQDYSARDGKFCAFVESSANLRNRITLRGAITKTYGKMRRFLATQQQYAHIKLLCLK